MSSIADIVDVEISIESPVAESLSYSKMLLVTDVATGTATVTMPTVAEIKKASDLTQYGYATTDAVYKASQVAFNQNPKPSSIFVTARQSSSGTVESITTTLDRAKTANSSWYGFVIVGSTVITSTIGENASEWADNNERMFGISWTSGELPVTITSRNRTWAIFGGNHGQSTTPDANNFLAVAWMAKCFGYDNGSETWAFKTIDGAYPSSLTGTEEGDIETAGGNTYQNYAGKNITRQGKTGSGEWIDIIRFRDWLINEIRVNMVNFFATNTKVPYTDAGIVAVQNIVTEVLTRGQQLGGIAQTEFDEDGNPIAGFTVSVPRAKNVASADKAQRRLTGVTFTAKLTGAIHFTEITGRLVY